jgi:hypothetical protein
MHIADFLALSLRLCSLGYGLVPDVRQTRRSCESPKAGFSHVPTASGQPVIDGIAILFPNNPCVIPIPLMESIVHRTLYNRSDCLAFDRHSGIDGDHRTYVVPLGHTQIGRFYTSN